MYELDPIVTKKLERLKREAVRELVNASRVTEYMLIKLQAIEIAERLNNGNV